MENCEADFFYESDNRVRRTAPPPPSTTRNHPRDVEESLQRCHSLPDGGGVALGRNYELSCLTAINQLSVKETTYISRLRMLAEQMQAVTTSACDRSHIMNKIIDFHQNALLDNFVKISHPSDICSTFKKCQRKFRLYVKFSDVRRDFSFLVMDKAEEILDLFKSRLLEYNFFLSQIKEICSNNKGITNEVSEVEEIIKSAYQKIIMSMFPVIREDDEEY